MPCNLVNFISVNWESEVQQGRQWGEDTRKKEENKRKERERERKKRVKSNYPSGARKGVQGWGIGYPHHGFGDVQRWPVSSVSVQECRFQ